VVSTRVLFIRLFAEVADAGIAAAVGEHAKAKLTRLGSVGQVKVSRYWKMPDYFEVYIDVRLRRDISASFGDTLRSFGTGWQAHGSGDERWAVWNAGPRATFFAPEVRWANMECYVQLAAGG
jgi:hypothetical protein